MTVGIFPTMQRNAGWATGYDKLLESFRALPIRLMHRIRRAEHTTPALSEKVEAPLSQVQAVNQVVKLTNEQVERPEVLVAGFLSDVCGTAASDLVVEDDWNAIEFVEVRQRCKILMTGGRAAMERNKDWGGGLERAYDFVPCLTWLSGAGHIERDLALARRILIHYDYVGVCVIKSVIGKGVSHCDHYRIVEESVAMSSKRIVKE